MMWEESDVLEAARQYLPDDAEVLPMIKSQHSSYVRTIDTGKKGNPSVAVAYRWSGGISLVMLKRDCAGWQAVFEDTAHPLYWYYLAEAQLQENLPAKAIESIGAGIRVKSSAIYAPKWNELIKTIRIQITQKLVALYPASMSTREGVKWGYINERGQFLIIPQFVYALPFEKNGLAVVTVANGTGLINEQAQYVVKPIYNSISSFTEGRATVIDDKGFWVIDDKGTVLSDKPHPFIGTYRDGRAVFADTNEQGYRYGYLNLEGKVVIPNKYEEANDFIDGKAVVKIKENQYALLGRNGEVLHTYPYHTVGPLSDGLMAVQHKEKEPFGYMDEQGKIIIKPQFTSAQAFKGGRAVVNTSVDDFVFTLGLIDKTGAFKIKPGYSDIEMLGEDRVAVGILKDSKAPYMGSIYAIADKDGRFFTEFVFNKVEKYQDGIASATNEQSTFFIDRFGKIMKNLPILKGNGTLSKIGNVIRADVNQRVSYYQPNGTLIYAQNTVIPLTKQYRVKEEMYHPNKDYLVYYPQIEGMATSTIQEQVNKRLKDLSQVKPIDPNVQLDYNYFGDFSVDFFNNQLVQLKLQGYNYPFGAAHGMPTQIYPPIDLVTGQFYKLQDLFKPSSDYVKILSYIIGQMIKTDPQYSYVFPNAFKGIAPDQPFYVHEDALYIYFPPYEIAPYAAGFPTFRIPFKEIMPIINTQGAFWKAFH
ncbi:WG repeat-containing protein [Brevibacillus halotolerans]|uniref:WG repeat-containing protein n=1 Tax=Brevibacillus halotolerans TaxID=1507437 RepID=UPI0015EE7057|nr:WG repeat-containing protein [Brevibacillus halotolerans]MBA4535245.1 WG repeat-containing protein [Brevibacillus halotolerans]